MFRTLATPDRLAAALVNATGLPVQSALNCPAAFVTLTVIVHSEGPADTCRLVTAIELEPPVVFVAAAAFTHVPPRLGGFPTRSPDGKVSVKLMFDSAGPPDGLVTV